MLTALIMAGGKGTRFWPLSTEKKPKQFLKLINNETMLQMTVNRIKSIIPMERIFVCTGSQYKTLVREQLPGIDERNIIIEPEGRNTAPCIALSTLIIKRILGDSNIVVLPADHLINNEEEFRAIILSANEYLRENSKTIVTLGMTANRPETGYGYIKFNEQDKSISNNKILGVEKFVEKPDLETAREYLKEGKYLWNGGMFIWNSTYILNEIKKHIPNTYEALNKIDEIDEKYLQIYIDENYVKTDSVSIDYGILEKTSSIVVIPSDIGWDDVGSWEAIERYGTRDKKGNIHIGDIESINGRNNLVVSSGNKVIIDELSDIYVIENDGKIIVGQKAKVSEIKEIKEKISN